MKEKLLINMRLKFSSFVACWSGYGGLKLTIFFVKVYCVRIADVLANRDYNYPLKTHVISCTDVGLGHILLYDSLEVSTPHFILHMK
ncbi:hypothetical protein LINPERHAP2_LOCUS41001 [Linum perenne]